MNHLIKQQRRDNIMKLLKCIVYVITSLCMALSLSIIGALTANHFELPEVTTAMATGALMVCGFQFLNHIFLQ